MGLRQKLDRAIYNYELLFISHMGFEYPEKWWTGNPGTILAINDYYFSFDDIQKVIDNEYPKEKVFEWYDYCVENESKINLESYIRGARDKFKVYLSAPISGRPLMDAITDFAQAKILVQESGCIPVSPLDEITFDRDWIDYMIVDIEKLSKCDRIWFFSMLPDSSGVKIERAIASSFGIKEFKLK